MNAPASPTLPSLTERAQAFAANVRAALSDLPEAELDELLDGLGADLEERLAEGDELGDPAQYAEELRAAAGLPPRDPSQRVKQPRRTVRERIDAAGVSIASWFDATPARRAFRDFIVPLRPVWWVLRAMIVVWAFLAIVGHPVVNGMRISALSIFLTLATIVLSVQWGRGKWLPNQWIKGLRTAGNWGAAILTLPFLITGWSGLTHTPQYIYEEAQPMLGLTSNGDVIENIYAYDCFGNLIDLVRLYDQNGNPIETTMQEPYGSAEPPTFWNEAEQVDYQYSLNPLAVDSEAWNAFPLTASPFDYSDEYGQLGEPQVLEPKRAEIAPLARDCQADPAATDDADAAADTEAGAEAGDAETADADAEAKPEGTEATPEGTEAKPESTEAKPENAEATP